MKLKLSAIKRLVATECAIDITFHEGIKRRPINSTIIFYSCNSYDQLNGLVIRDNATGILYAVIGRVPNLHILAE